MERDPEARWIVFNDALIGSFIASTGANVFNGTKYTPDIPAMRILDTAGSSDSVYNRYANIVVGTNPDPDKVEFKLLYEDFYSITINPVSSKLKELHIKYLLFPNNQYFNVEAAKRGGLIPVTDKPVDNFWILEIRQPDIH